MSIQVYIERHNPWDKRYEFTIGDVWSAQVDNDDVDNACVEAASEYLQDIVTREWDEETFKKYFESTLRKEWKNDKDIQAEYPNVDDYLKQRI